MKIQIRQPQCFTEQGRKDNQEDTLWPKQADTQQRVFLMCDGVGGQDSGEVASQTASEAIGTYLTSHPSPDGYVTEDMFNVALDYGYDELDKVDNGALKKMATTMTCLVLHRGGALVAHIGDSRIYHIRPSLADETGRSGIVFQTWDHSLVNDLLRVGEITEEEAQNFPQKNVITRAMQPHLERRYRADVTSISDVQPGDYFFLCCDGVLEQLSNSNLGAILSDASLDDEGKIAAIKAVCDGKTRDNYTCWLIPIDSVEREACDVEQEEELQAVVETEEPVSATPEQTVAVAAQPGMASPQAAMSGQAVRTYSQTNGTATVQKTNNRKPWIFVIIFLAGCLVAAAGIWAYQYFSTPSKPDKPIEIQSIDHKNNNKTGKKDTGKSKKTKPSKSVTSKAAQKADDGKGAATKGKKKDGAEGAATSVPGKQASNGTSATNQDGGKANPDGGKVNPNGTKPNPDGGSAEQGTPAGGKQGPGTTNADGSKTTPSNVGGMTTKDVQNAGANAKMNKQSGDTQDPPQSSSQQQSA